MRPAGDMPRAALERVGAICLELPGSVETTSFGHPTWKARRKAFAYVGQHGWVSFKLQGRLPWGRLRGLLREAHRLID